MKVLDELPISGRGVGWEGRERKDSPSGGISIMLCPAQWSWITHSSWRQSLPRAKATSPSAPHCRHLALVCICPPDWFQPFAITWDKPVSLPRLPPVKHKGSTPPLPASLVFLSWKSYLVAAYCGLLLVCLCYKPYLTPKPGSFFWSQAGKWKKRYYSPFDKTSFVILKSASVYLFIFPADGELNKDPIFSILCLFEIVKSRSIPDIHMENCLYDTGPTLFKVLWIFN